MRKCDFSLTFSHWHPRPRPGREGFPAPVGDGMGWDEVSKVGREGPGKEGRVDGWVGGLGYSLRARQGKLANWQWRSAAAARASTPRRATPEGDNPK